MKKKETKIFRLFTPVVIILLISGLVGCDFFFPKPKRVDFVGDRFSITKPARWKIMNNLNEDADLQMANPAKEAYTVVFSEGIKEMAEFGIFSRDKYAEYTVGMILNNLEQSQLYPAENLEGGIHNGVKHKITGTLKGLNFIYWHITIETPEYYNQIVVWSLDSHFKQNESDFNTVINSFDTNYE